MGQLEGGITRFVDHVQAIAFGTANQDIKIGLCSFGTQRLISRISHAPARVVDGRFQQHFTEFKPPTPRTHGSAERALD